MSTPFLIVPPSGKVTSYAFRLPPKAPLKKSLCECAEIIFARMDKDKTSSLFVITVVGSLRSVTLRLANASKTVMGDEDELKHKNKSDQSFMGGSNGIREWNNERFEIVSLVGTFSRCGSCHLHLSISDSNGVTYGGHLIDGEVFTTAEVVLGSAEHVAFPREYDAETGYQELSPEQILVDDDYFLWNNELRGLLKLTVAVFVGFMLGVSYVEKKESRK